MKKIFIKMNVTYYKLLDLFKKTDAPKYLDQIVLYGIFGVLFISYIYGDILITTRNGINIWSAIESGQLKNYYSYSIEVNATLILPTHSFHPAYYDFPLYIFFAIWNLPLFILERFFSVEIFTSVGCLLYMKLILLPFLFGSAVILRKICEQIGISVNHAKWAVFLYLSSGFVMSSIFVMTQYDIIMMTFLLLGLLMYIKNNMKMFLLFFAIAVSFKFFALFVFVPLVLLKYKKIMLIILYVLVSLSITILFRIPFMFDTAGVEIRNGFSMRLSTNMLFSNVYNIGLTSIYLFVAAFISICIYCYIKKIDSDTEHKMFPIYIPLLSLASFFIFSPSYPYWFVMITPFLPILVFQNNKYFKINLLLDTFCSGAMIMLQQIIFYWCYSIKVLQPMILPKIFGAVEDMRKPVSINDVYSLLPLEISGILNTVFVVCLITILIINFPGAVKIKNNNTDVPIVIERSVVWFRMFVGAAICALPIAAYLASLIVFGFR